MALPLQKLNKKHYVPVVTIQLGRVLTVSKTSLWYSVQLRKPQSKGLQSADRQRGVVGVDDAFNKFKK